MDGRHLITNSFPALLHTSFVSHRHLGEHFLASQLVACLLSPSPMGCGSGASLCTPWPLFDLDLDLVSGFSPPPLPVTSLLQSAPLSVLLVPLTCMTVCLSTLPLLVPGPFCFVLVKVEHRCLPCLESPLTSSGRIAGQKRTWVLWCVVFSVIRVVHAYNRKSKIQNHIKKKMRVTHKFTF